MVDQEEECFGSSTVESVRVDFSKLGVNAGVVRKRSFKGKFSLTTASEILHALQSTSFDSTEGTVEEGGKEGEEELNKECALEIEKEREKNVRDVQAKSNKNKELSIEELIESVGGSGNDFDVLKVPRDKLLEVAIHLIMSLVEKEGLKLSRKDVKCFVKCTCAEYGKTPFHNFYHAVSVMQVVRSIVPTFQGFTKEEKLLLCLTALCHDAGHLGYTNQFLAKTYQAPDEDTCSEGCCSDMQDTAKDSAKLEQALQEGSDLVDFTHKSLSAGEEKDKVFNQVGKVRHHGSNELKETIINDPSKLVSRYGSLSTQEKHHVMVTLKLFRNHSNILKAILGEDRDAERCRRVSTMILHVILCTDLGVHQSLLHEMSQISECDPLFRKKLKAAAILMHAADLSNAARPFEAHYDWSAMLTEEKQLREGKEAAPSVDSHKFISGEVFFCESFILPTWLKVAQVYGEQVATSWVEQIKANMERWKGLVGNASDEQVQSPGQSRAQLSFPSPSSHSSSSSPSAGGAEKKRVDRPRVLGEHRRPRLSPLNSDNSFLNNSEHFGNEEEEEEDGSDVEFLQLEYTDSFIVRNPAQKICNTLLDNDNHHCK